MLNSSKYCFVLLLFLCIIALSVRPTHSDLFAESFRLGASRTWLRDGQDANDTVVGLGSVFATRQAADPVRMHSSSDNHNLRGRKLDGSEVAITPARTTTATATATGVQHVHVYHFIMQKWGGDHDEVGIINGCGSDNMVCHWTQGDALQGLKNKATADYESFSSSHAAKASGRSTDGGIGVKDSYISVALYNFHSWWEKTRDHYPHVCNLRTNLTLVESEEARQRYGEMFDPTFKNFDGFSTTHPTASVQRVYREAYLHDKDLLSDQYIHNFSSLIKGGIYVASDCHTRDKANAHRDDIIFKLRSNGLRIDGLGRCMYSNPDEILMPRTRNTDYNLLVKRQNVAKFMFYMAFENSIEPGYVTEKPFDGLLAGTVPIYVGDDVHLKTLLPHPKSVIFVADYNGNYTKLADYLKYLMTNETAYEEHRAWRRSFNGITHRSSHSALKKSWFCQICDWAVKMAPVHHKRTRICNSSDASGKELFDHNNVEGKAVQGDTRQIFLVEKHTLRAIPDVDTFYALKLDWKDVVHLTESEIAKIPKGAPMPKLES